jgi:serine/threonine protein kinase
MTENTPATTPLPTAPLDDPFVIDTGTARMPALAEAPDVLLTVPLPELGAGAPDELPDGAFDIAPDRIIHELRYDGDDDAAADDDLRRIRFDRGSGRMLRSGNSADVHSATTAGGRRVAVKVFREPASELHSAAEQRESVAKEWRASSAFFSEHVVRSLACYEVWLPQHPAPRWVLVMTLVPGPDLKQVMEQVRRGAVLDATTQLRWLESGLEGLVALQRANHQLRDIKPANIGLTSPHLGEAEPVFLDHGAARRDGSHTLDHVGTVGYAAPEYIRKDARVDLGKVDLYSFGAALIDVFTGGEGFEGEHELASRSLLAAPRLDDPRLAPEAVRILRGLLVKDPALRPSAGELLGLLRDPSRPVPDWDADAPYVTTGVDDRDDPAPTVPWSSADLAEVEQPPAPVEGLTGRPRAIRVTPHGAEATGATGRIPGGAVPLNGPLELLPLTDDVARFERRDERPAVRRPLLERIAGVDSRYVTRGGDRTTYRILGMLLMVYALYATAATTAFVTIVTGSTETVTVLVGLVLGISVAIVVIGLDRSIVAAPNANLDDLDDPALDANPLRRRRAGSVWVRVLFAVLFALAIGEVANQVIFQRDIDARIAADVDGQVAERAGSIRADFQARLDTEQERAALAEEAIADYQERVDAAYARAEGEANGTFGTMVAECGDQCMRYYAQAQELEAAQQVFETEQRAIIADAQAEITGLEAQIADVTDTARAQLSEDDGVIAREAALWAMLLEDPGMLAKYVIITALLFMLELAAVIIKFATKGNNYERTQARALRQQERVDQLHHGMLRDLAKRRAARNAVLLERADNDFYRGS